MENNTRSVCYNADIRLVIYMNTHFFQFSFKKALLAVIVVIGSIASVHFVTTEAAEALPDVCANPQDAAQQKNCRDLAALYADIAEKEKELAAQKRNTNSISGEVTSLQKEIEKAQLDIRKKNLEISTLAKDITNKSNTIVQLSRELNREKSSLAQIIRKKNELDSYTMFEYLLSSENVSEFYGDADSFDFIQGSLAKSFNDIMFLQGKTDAERRALMERKNQEDDIKYSLEQSKKEVEVKKNEKSNLLTISKNKEKTYEQVIADRKAEATKIRSELIRFQGSGIQSRSISFGEAYDYAKNASAKTGVRPAFIMAIMQQETGFGANVGGCNIRNGETGEGIYIRTGNPSIRNMVPGNFPNFVKITSALGLDWKTTPISCVAMNNGVPYGFGGAMGYTQFIPNTWMGVEARVRANLGVSVANPWNPEHAVMATAVFLRDLGAQAQTYTTEYNAACRYYGSCAVHAYGTSVMNKAASIQITIDRLEEINN